MISGDKESILKEISLTYKSLSEPNFSFVDKAISSNPYRDIVTEIGKKFLIEDIADTNDDVSFRYKLSMKTKTWILEISMVGPYAVLLKEKNEYEYKIVDSDLCMLEESKIISLCRQGNIVFLKRHDLEVPVDLKLFNADPENVCIYQALFSDVDVLPWAHQEEP